MDRENPLYMEVTWMRAKLDLLPNLVVFNLVIREFLIYIGLSDLADIIKTDGDDVMKDSAGYYYPGGRRATQLQRQDKQFDENRVWNRTWNIEPIWTRLCIEHLQYLTNDTLDVITELESSRFKIWAMMWVLRNNYDSMNDPYFPIPLLNLKKLLISEIQQVMLLADELWQTNYWEYGISTHLMHAYHLDTYAQEHDPKWLALAMSRALNSLMLKAYEWMLLVITIHDFGQEDLINYLGGL